jgi:Protein SCAI
LSQELSKHVDEYTSTYEPDDQLEWSLVLGEIKSFLEADAILNILDADSNPMVISHRYLKFPFFVRMSPRHKKKRSETDSRMRRMPFCTYR